MPSITFGRWNPTEVMERRLDGDWPNPTPYATNIVTPTSISSTGTGNSSSIGTNGSVTFTDCATLTLNGVFTSDYDNYQMVMSFLGGVSTSYVMYYRMRSSSTDATGNDYTYQRLSVNGTTVSGARTSATNYGYVTVLGYDQTSGVTMSIFGPNLAQPTVSRTVTIGRGSAGAVIWDMATTHSLSTSYDGISIICEGDHITGLVSVYGLAN